PLPARHARGARPDPHGQRAPGRRRTRRPAAARPSGRAGDGRLARPRGSRGSRGRRAGNPPGTMTRLRALLLTATLCLVPAGSARAVVGGHDVPAGKYPYVAYITIDFSFACS